MNDTLATRKNLSLWHLSASSHCSFCLQPESLLHIVCGCNTYLTEGRFTWRHNSALKFLPEALQTIQNAKLYVDLPGYHSPCIVTGNNLRPDILLSTTDNILYIIELTVCFKTNLSNNALRKDLRYSPLLSDLVTDYEEVNLKSLH